MTSHLNLSASFTYKCQCTTIILATLVDDLCKDSAIGILGSGEVDFLKVFTIYGDGSHLDQYTATILAILSFPCPREAPNKS